MDIIEIFIKCFVYGGGLFIFLSLMAVLGLAGHVNEDRKSTFWSINFLKSLSLCNLSEKGEQQFRFASIFFKLGLILYIVGLVVGSLFVSIK